MEKDVLLKTTVTALVLLFGFLVESHYEETGEASWYGQPFHGRLTASGQKYDMNAMTAAHPTLDFGSKVKVVEKETGRSVVVTVNDRGPFVDDRIIDLSKEAARKLGILEEGVVEVSLHKVASQDREGFLKN